MLSSAAVEKKKRKSFLFYLVILIAVVGIILLSRIHTNTIDRSSHLPSLSKTVVPRLRSHFPDHFDSDDGYPFLLFFLHIPKTAGTSFRHYMRDELCKHDQRSQFKCCELHGPVDWPVGVEDNILDTETNKLKCSVGDKETGILRLRLLQSHLKGKTVLGLTFLRDPYASIFSALGHDLWKRRITQDSMAGKLQKYLDGSCTTWNATRNIGTDCDYPYQGYDLRNRISRFLLGLDKQTRVPEVEGATVEDVKHIIQHELFFVGIAEYYEASLCLLEYQLGIFDASQCNRTCGGDDASGSVKKKMKLRKKMREKVLHHNAAKDHHVDDLHFTLNDLKVIQQLSLQDAQVYAHGLELFMKRVKVVEEEHGVTMICPSAEGV